MAHLDGGRTLLELDGFGVKTDAGWSTPTFSRRVHTAESVLLSGRGGSGKSLICEYLAGIHRPGTSEIGHFRGPNQKLPRVALVPQDARLAVLPTDKVRTVLARRNGTHDVARLLEQLRLDGDRLFRLPFRDLSASERYRVLLTRALSDSPDMLVVDGLEERLDPLDLQAVLCLLEARLKTGLAVLLTSRDATMPGFTPTHRVALGVDSSQEAPVPLLKRVDAEALPTHRHPLVEVERLRVARGVRGLLRRRPASFPVDGATFYVRHGETVVLLGPAGCGKTTLLDTIAGLRGRHSGKIRVSGQDVSDARGRRLAKLRQRVQLVFQDAAAVLDGSRTVRAHLAEAASISQGETTSPSRWLERLNLSPRLLEARADTLSWSEAARIDLGRSLVLQPRVILFDAPRSAGLESDRGMLASLIAAEKARGLSFLVATSSPRVASILADRIVVMHAGRAVEIGERDSVLNNPAHPFTRSFLKAEAHTPPDPRHPMTGCSHVAHCERKVLPYCDSAEPPLLPLEGRPRAAGRHRVACYHPLGEDMRVPGGMDEAPPPPGLKELLGETNAGPGDDAPVANSSIE